MTPLNSPPAFPGREYPEAEKLAGPLIRVENLSKYFTVSGNFPFSGRKKIVKAVDGVSFSIARGRTLGVVGESGCGKSTTGRAVLRLHEPTSGRIFYNNAEITGLDIGTLRRMRPKMQIVFQDSYDSLNPRHSVAAIICEPLKIHTCQTTLQMKKRMYEIMDLVGLNPNHAVRYPHEFSGGQRQRINIARALVLEPEFVVCDEPISALDVSIQAQVVNLFKDLQRKLGLTLLFIAHDLSMVKHISHEVAVMYLGNIMETASREAIFSMPLHPYTQALISAVPIPSPRLERSRKRIQLEGEVPSPVNPPLGCVFHTRCPIARKICREKKPCSREIFPRHYAACHLADDKGTSIIS